ncbi:hypothetical protein HGRIS_004457 [Hohenbuehelia grisea]|uniref:Transcription initiation factor IIF subunit beta n=1 Tax=Hohenbuehelia grisea TaxID=104357 RepID=A0ABR3JC66_9AGAR
MEDAAVDDDKKPFEPEAGQEEDSQPDPDEQLMLDQGNGRVWLVKIPKFLMERWSAINAEDVHLATIRVWHDVEAPNEKKRTRIVLFLPPNVDPENPSDTPPPSDPSRPSFPQPTNYPGSEPDQYELEMVNESVENQIVVAERPKVAALSATPNVAGNTRARTTILTGRIKHDCNLRPVFSERYRRQMRERTKKYNTPKRQIRMIEDAGVSGGRGGINRLSSGVGVGSGNAFGDLIKSKQKPAKGAFERMARMPRNQLLDLIFSYFRETPRWGLKVLREKTQQPEAYLKEVLQEVALLHRSGEHNGMWELKDNFKDSNAKAENVPLSMDIGTPGDFKMEDDIDEEDDDDDDDMEEVS